MRRIKFCFICLAALTVAACQDSLENAGSEASGEGEVLISLSAEGRTSSTTKATTESLPDVNDFTVEIFKTDGNVRLYKDTYANTDGVSIPLNVGEYKLLAWYGDSLGVGFNSAHFAGTQSFVVEQQKTAEVPVTAKLANVKVAVEYGEEIADTYETYYTIVRARDNKNYELTFASDETSAGYLPTGTLTLEVYADIYGELKYYTYEAGTFSANDFVTFYIDTKPASGTLKITATIDKETETVTENVEVSYTTLPKDEPTISFSEVTDLEAEVTDLDIEVIEGIEPASSELRANIVAEGEIASCVLNISSSYLSSLGIGTSVELVGIDETTAALLEQAGIKWYGDMSGSEYGYVDFSGLIEYIAEQHYVSDGNTTTISIKVVDSLEQTITSDEITITNTAPEFTYNGVANDYDIWGWKVLNQTISYTSGKANPDYIVLQYSTDNTNWTNVTLTDDGTSTLTCEKASGLTAGTEYTFRAIYNGDEANAQSKTITTESANQVGNASMEDWVTQESSYKVVLGSSYTRYWWRPWAEDETDPWWDVNSKLSMPSSVTASSHNYKNFPTVGYSTEKYSAGSRSAHIIVTNVGNLNTSGTAVGTDYIGELFIGTANDDGEHETDGHEFTTRPAKLAFDYRYYGKNSETFSADFILYGTDGTTELATYSSTTAGPDTDPSWATMEVPLEYTVTNMKAGKIYMSFKASTADDPDISTGVDREFAGETYNIHAGSDLYIDNIRLIYEE